MSYLIDTCVLVRLASTVDPLHDIAKNAIAQLHRQGESLFISPQNLIEFRNAATRSAALNGVGLSLAATEALSATFESRFPLLHDIPAIFPAWKSIVQSLQVIGKQVHDARLVAVCHVHQVSHILTFNTSHFKRLAAFGPGVVVVDPLAFSGP